MGNDIGAPECKHEITSKGKFLGALVRNRDASIMVKLVSTPVGEYMVPALYYFLAHQYMTEKVLWYTHIVFTTVTNNMN